MLAGNDRTYIYRLGYEAGPLAFVGERFYVKPLLEELPVRIALLPAGAFGRLLRVRPRRLRLARARGAAPRDVLDAFSEEFPLVYDGHEGALDYSSLENHMPPYHGWKSRNDVRKEEAGKFFQYVNKAVTDYLVAGTDRRRSPREPARAPERLPPHLHHPPSAGRGHREGHRRHRGPRALVRCESRHRACARGACDRAAGEVWRCRCAAARHRT